MTVSGLVLTLDDPAVKMVEHLSLLGLLSGDPRITVGEKQGLKLPLALETETSDESETTVEWLSSLQGVVAVDVVFVGLE